MRKGEDPGVLAHRGPRVIGVKVFEDVTKIHNHLTLREVILDYLSGPDLLS